MLLIVNGMMSINFVGSYREQKQWTDVTDVF